MCLWRTEEDVRSPVVGVIDGYELTDWELNSSPFEEQSLLLTSEPSLRAFYFLRPGLLLSLGLAVLARDCLANRTSGSATSVLLALELQVYTTVLMYAVSLGSRE